MTFQGQESCIAKHKPVKEDMVLVQFNERLLSLRDELEGEEGDRVSPSIRTTGPSQNHT